MARILVVEDDPDIRRLVLRRLQQGGHRAQGAADASEALSVIGAKGSPDLVILDVNMPEVNGFELLGRLREELGPSLPAVFLSGRMRPEDIETGRALGAKYLTKPFETTALLNAIDVLLTEAAEAAAEAEADPNEW